MNKASIKSTTSDGLRINKYLYLRHETDNNILFFNLSVFN